jgi:hypothetical protein
MPPQQFEGTLVAVDTDGAIIYSATRVREISNFFDIAGGRLIFPFPKPNEPVFRL